jgi:putative endonuclease
MVTAAGDTAVMAPLPPPARPTARSRPPTPSAADARRALGRRGEEAAARWYREAGYDIAARNWRCAEGEIDLVVIDPARSVAVICEVKTRSSSAFGSPAEAVTTAKQRRLRRLATRWLAERAGGPSLRSVRFDVVAVMDDKAKGLGLEVVHDAF